MKKALVFIDYDMLIRHFVLSGALSELEKRYEVTYVIHDDKTTDKTVINVDVDALKLPRMIRFEIPRRRMGAWDKLYCITALSNQRGTKNYAHRRRLIAVTRTPRLARFYELLSLPGIFPLVRRKLIKDMGHFEPLRELLARERPDIVVHPSILSGYFINELTQLCPEFGIPLVLLMNSWDNPSTKAMNTGMPDRLVVWGQQTRQHAIEYMKMPPNRVLEFGAAQFDVYREPIAETDAELRAQFQVPLDKQIILYAGVSKNVNETAHLLEIDQAIEDGRIPSAHVLYRPHPWRQRLVVGETNFFDVKFRHVTMDPFMADFYRRIMANPTRAFELADYRVTARLLRVVAGVISPLSTMLLEAVMHGLPVIMFYPAGEKDEAGLTIDLGKELPHFAEFWGPEGIQIVTKPDALWEGMNRMLSAHQTDEVRDALREHARRYVVMDGASYATRVADLADELVAARQASGARPRLEPALAG